MWQNSVIMEHCNAVEMPCAENLLIYFQLIYSFLIYSGKVCSANCTFQKSGSPNIRKYVCLIQSQGERIMCPIMTLD